MKRYSHRLFNLNIKRSWYTLSWSRCMGICKILTIQFNKKKCSQTCPCQCRLTAWARWGVARGPHEHRGPYLYMYVVYSMFLMFINTDFVGSINTINIDHLHFYSCEWLCR